MLRQTAAFTIYPWSKSRVITENRHSRKDWDPESFVKSAFGASRESPPANVLRAILSWLLATWFAEAPLGELVSNPPASPAGQLARSVEAVEERPEAPIGNAHGHADQAFQ